ncbi:G-type lectin S-receptor-like serine/threonine-protein kinase At2g19130 [Macadamia integrifolia]|uniref:G-type lectin S-receptor-like serine/threonine-protein kinase At2g19130 n=1 Tax=Macadamia integrifolia TaxID=60698 RepID=UPI001C4FF41B|nr:G-type lectin S-receptor-like serine/threonine-protein kinase At2g19130 [Macadamia integrifolia]
MGITQSSWFLLSVMFHLFSLKTLLSNGASTISVGDSISGDQTIISEPAGTFELGFFATGNKSQNYYIGIWYRKISERTIVWEANRDKPISDKFSSQLKLLEDGNLVLLDSSKTHIWSTNLTSLTFNSTEAVLLDSGNLVLRHKQSSSTFIWQSFDHQTNNFLPGAKLGRNKLTNTSYILTSWKNSEDPAMGIFSHEQDPTGSSQYFLLWNKSQRYWTSGYWNGHNFGTVPQQNENNYFNYSYVSNHNESYFTYSVYNSSFITRLVLDVTGQTKQLVWVDGVGWNLFYSQPSKICDVYALCGAFGTCNEQNLPFCECLQGFSSRSTTDYNNLSDWSGGCVRKAPLLCGNNVSTNGEKDGFFSMPNMRLPLNPQSLEVESAQGCKFACLNNCSCTAYAYDGGCSVWEGDLLNLQRLSQGDSGGGNLYLKLAASELSNSGGKKKGSVIGAIVCVISGVVLLLGSVLVLFCWWQRRNVFGPSNHIDGSLVQCSYRNLQIATKNFSEQIGRGGFGCVFKGTLPDSTVVAVKKLEGLSQGEKQFRSEVSSIGMIQHINLIRHRGFCCQGTKKLLVYDLMPKGSLDSHLFHDKKGFEVLDWKMRYQIAIGIARGLAYLHEKCRDCIIHCDIKPENILLDAEFCPKVADFGMAKLVGRDFSRVLTTMRGTIGYLAPEWISGVPITAKADVYSYGMMLFELISGRRNSSQDGDSRVRHFPTWAARKINENGEIIDLLDCRLECSADHEELTRACKVACWCIQYDEAHRPSMGLVVQMLEGVMDVNLPPFPEILQAFSGIHEDSSEYSSNWGSRTCTSQAKRTMSSTVSIT